MDSLRFVFSLCFLIGFSLYAWASLFRRVPGAPGVGGGGRHFPWQRREWFTPYGYRVRVAGYVLWTAGMLGTIVLFAIRAG